MSICRLMIADFEGKRQDLIFAFGKNAVYYDRYNLEVAIDYSEDLIQEGYITEPFLDYNLKDFIEWAKKRLKTIDQENEKKKSYQEKIKLQLQKKFSKQLI